MNDTDKKILDDFTKDFEKNTYEVYVKCSNCAFSGVVWIFKGKLVKDQICAQCETKQLSRVDRPTL